ncbi:hypothetical protein ACLBSO_35065, partial [Klebsiella pneumoniae]
NTYSIETFGYVWVELLWAVRAEAQAANLRGAQCRSDVASQLAVVYAQAESALRRYTLAVEEN